jgi:pimeloyl-ACP methyl ester carboxylesterase
LKLLVYQPINTHKPLFIYLPGMDGSGELLASQTQIWQKFDVRCLYIPPKEMNWEEIIDKLVTLIKNELTLHGERKIYLCGESFGACIALKLIARIPDFIHQVILINSASAFNEQPILRLGPYITKMMSDLVYRNATLLLLPFLAKLEAIAIHEKNRLIKVMQQVPPQIVSWRLALLQTFQYQVVSNYPRLLIIASAQDQLLPSVAEARKLNQVFPNSQMTILPNSGHCCLLENQVDLYKIIDNYHQKSGKINSL